MWRVKCIFCAKLLYLATQGQLYSQYFQLQQLVGRFGRKGNVLDELEMVSDPPG